MGYGTGGSAAIMNSINSFNEIIEYIEKNLTNEIDINKMAAMANMSIYEFRRIFSFAANMPISEYIRKRRLSAAALELIEKKESITQTALKYGYDSSSSFTRAFKEFHGFSPNEISKNNVNMFTKIGFQFGISGGEDIQYRIITEPEFYICGLTEFSDMKDTECCENVWQSFYKTDIPDSCNDEIYAAYINGDNSVRCTIGKKSAEKTENSLRIPSGKWVCFSVCGAEDAAVNKFYNDIIFRWLESGAYRRNTDLPNIEVFPKDMENDDFLWEIRIPIMSKTNGD